MLHPTFRSIPSMQSELNPVDLSNVSLSRHRYEVNTLLGFLLSAFLFNSMHRESGSTYSKVDGIGRVLFLG